MNISRSNQLPTNLPSVGTAAASKNAREAAAQSAPAPKRDPAQKATDEVDQAQLSKRLANVATKVDHRVQHAIESGKLDDAQLKAVQEAADKFQQLMTRIGNADFEGASPKRQVWFALHQLGQQLQGILGPAEGDGLSGSAVKGTTASIDKLA